MVSVPTDVHRTEVVRRYPLPTLDTCERVRELYEWPQTFVTPNVKARRYYPPGPAEPPVWI